MKPFVSFLMPVFNGEKFLEEAIESVLAQTYKDFEFIIIDDGSTDRSVEIIRSFFDSRIKFYQNSSNLGISKTLNRGIDLAEGDWIARMDADDISLPHRLEKQIDFIEKNPDGALYSCWVQKIDMNGEKLENHRLNPEYYYYNLNFSCWIFHPTMIFNKEIVKSIGKYTVDFSEDFELIWNLSRVYKFYIIPQILVKYRVNENSLWQVIKKSEYRDMAIKQVKRNMLFYLDSHLVDVEKYHAEILSYYFTPKKFNNKEINQICSSLALLEKFTKVFNNCTNINLNRNIVWEAFYQKRLYTLKYYYLKFSLFYRILFIIKTNSYGMFFDQVKNRVKMILLFLRP
ncbi:glycosyltransferase family 2 protein [Cyclobacterium jeungdonense]|uniref:Glycosyltransferase n=1 Tax=Cyclobacterium jeungdonense TaxID=708087 RepID=A0ABT8C8J7_9BACT|nr:glycosyltransferase [Cyclobacterium jeungdonense]MDN3688856.1 glycosyltransferase [Cyclobacterium jeungdonense]